MAEATILENCQYVNYPGWEVVRLECTDGDTYRSKKFKNIRGAIACSNDASANKVLNTRWTGQVVTIDLKGTGTTDIVVSLLIIGES